MMIGLHRQSAGCRAARWPHVLVARVLRRGRGRDRQTFDKCLSIFAFMNEIRDVHDLGASSAFRLAHRCECDDGAFDQIQALSKDLQTSLRIQTAAPNLYVLVVE